MVRQELRSGLRDENVQLALQGVLGDWVVRAVRSEDDDGFSGRHPVDGGLV